MWCNQIFSLINQEEVQNIIVADNFETANQISRMVYGEEAYAVDTTQYPVRIGNTHVDGVFYDEDGGVIERNPTESEEIRRAVDKTAAMGDRQSETEVEIDYRLSILELGL